MYYVMADTITEKETGYYKCGFRVLGEGVGSHCWRYVCFVVKTI